MAAKKQKIQIEGHKLMYHVNEVSKWMNNEIVAPIYVEIGPINSCNHNCIFCALDYLKSKGSAIDKDVLIKNLKDMAEFGVKSIMFGGEGEPLLYPHLPEVIEKAKKSGLDIAITSNGSQLSEEKTKLILKHLSWIKISMDAGTKETYAKIHGCQEEDFSELLNNIRFACDYRKDNGLDCRIGCQILLLEDNVVEVEELILKLKDIGVDYVVLKPYSQHPESINKLRLDINKHDKTLIGLSNKYSREDFRVIYRKLTFNEIEKEEIDYDVCYGINFFALIDALGNVIPCNIFYEKEEYYYGNIYKNVFSDIWKSDKRKGVIKKLYEKGCSQCRKGCRMNFVNKYLYSLKNKDVEHINFI
jgi:MoaA/NifB/PqqE/SkfB family radical SAM enzyme